MSKLTLYLVIASLLSGCSVSSPKEDTSVGSGDTSLPADSSITKETSTDGPRDGAVDFRRDQTVPDSVQPEGSPPIGDGPVADQGASCDPATFKTSCTGTVANYCVGGKPQSIDCAQTLNKLCVQLDSYSDARCVLAHNVSSSQCEPGSSLETCKDYQGDTYALRCEQNDSGFLAWYQLCQTGYCMLSQGYGISGECTGPPCSTDYKKCVGDDLHFCEVGFGLRVYDCTLSGDVCYESPLGNDWAQCDEQGLLPCDPLTFQRHCTSTTSGRFCGHYIGLIQDFNCIQGMVCCFDLTDPDLDPTEVCCDPPPP